jgi:hypothetical protein
VHACYVIVYKCGEGHLGVRVLTTERELALANRLWFMPRIKASLVFMIDLACLRAGGTLRLVAARRSLPRHNPKLRIPATKSASERLFPQPASGLPGLRDQRGIYSTTCNSMTAVCAAGSSLVRRTG